MNTRGLLGPTMGAASRLGILFVLSAAVTPLAAADFVRGDVNGDGVVSLADAHPLLAYFFAGAEPPACLNAADVNDSGSLEQDDVHELIDDIFRFGSDGLNLKRPFPDPGPDPTPNGDPDLVCDEYGGGAPLADALAKIEVLDAIAPGGEEAAVEIVIAVYHSAPIAGYTGSVRVGPDLAANVKSEPLDLTLTFISSRSSDGSARLDEGAVRFGFLPTRDLDPAHFIAPGDGAPALRLTVCLPIGTPAGDYPLVLEDGELVDAASGRRIDPVLEGGTLSVLADVAVEKDCNAPPPPPPPPPSPYNVVYRLDDQTAAPGDAVVVPFIIRADGEVQGYAFSADFDEEVLRAESVEQVWQKPEGVDPQYSFAIYELDNANENPGSAGVDEGFIVGGVVFDFLEPVTMPADTDNVALRFHFTVDPEAPDGSTEIRFLDGGQGSGAPLENIVTIEGIGTTPDSAESFLLIDCTLHLVEILPDITVYVRGDANGDGEVNISDPSATLGHLFLGDVRPRCEDGADANDDGNIDLSDASYTLNFLFIDGPTLPPPYPAPGEDPTPDALSCGG